MESIFISSLEYNSAVGHAYTHTALFDLALILSVLSFNLTLILSYLVSPLLLLFLPYVGRNGLTLRPCGSHTEDDTSLECVSPVLEQYVRECLAILDNGVSLP